MIVVGINLPSTELDKNLKDGGVCVVEDGQIKFAIAEERISREKRAGGFQASLQYALDNLNLKKTDIDLIVYSSCCETIRPQFRIKNFENTKTLPCNHHFSHALSAYLTSPFDEAIIIVCDAGGNLLDSSNAQWWISKREQHSYYIARGNDISLDSRDFENPRTSGLAEIYRAFTHYLGWRSSIYANKVMALSAFGDPNFSLGKKIFYMDQYGSMLSVIENNPNDPILMVKNLLKKYCLETIEERKPDDRIIECHKNLASWIQSETEKALFAKINWLVKKTGIQNLCLSGGLAYNCSAIGKILDYTSAKNIFVHPASGDHGQSVGNAIYGYIEVAGNIQRSSFFSPYLGGEENLSLESIRKYTKENSNLEISYQKNIALCVAELIAKNEIVAWFQGRSEYGPRALGNRSILANPSDSFMRDKLNVIKGRESFMPFAPSVISERAKDFFEISFESPYMTAAFKTVKNKIDLIPAVVHVDDTSRIQMIRKEQNSRFYEVISHFYKLTNIPLVLNTSFNGPGEPIVETFRDALDTFLSLDIKYLAAGDFLIKKKKSELNSYNVQLNDESFNVYINEKIIPKLKKVIYQKCPFSNLRPRERFQLYFEYVDWLKIGRKTTTIRYKKNSIDYPVALIMPLYSTESFKQEAEENYAGHVRITHFSIKKFKNLNTTDAIRDGFNSVDELKKILKEIYQEISDEDPVSIYSISSVENTNQCAS